ncbi:MAG TPA: hypothetical protein VFW07_20815 [Parafilimonas sp.]|nr:hypothetical protein [Parafilimonas sp.]
MKKTLSLLAILSLLFIQKTHAQLERGNVMVGADFANFNLGLEKDAGFSILVNPKAAWFIKDNIAIGAYIKLGFSKENSDAATRTDYGIGPWARYYVSKPDMNLLKHGRWFGEGNVGIEGKNFSKGPGNTNGLGIGFGPGYAYFITPNIGFETLLKWNPLIGFGDEPFQSNLTLNFGFQIYLPGKATLNKVKSQEGM